MFVLRLRLAPRLSLDVCSKLVIETSCGIQTLVPSLRLRPLVKFNIVYQTYHVYQQNPRMKSWIQTFVPIFHMETSGKNWIFFTHLTIETPGKTHTFVADKVTRKILREKFAFVPTFPLKSRLNLGLCETLITNSPGYRQTFSCQAWVWNVGLIHRSVHNAPLNTRVRSDLACKLALQTLGQTKTFVQCLHLKLREIPNFAQIFLLKTRVICRYCVTKLSVKGMVYLVEINMFQFAYEVVKFAIL